MSTFYFTAKHSAHGAEDQKYKTKQKPQNKQMLLCRKGISKELKAENENK